MYRKDMFRQTFFPVGF